MKTVRIATFPLVCAFVALMPIAAAAASPLQEWAAAVEMGYYNCNQKFQSATVDHGPNPLEPVNKCISDEGKKEKAAFDRATTLLASKPKALAIAKELHAAQMAGFAELPGLLKLPVQEYQGRITKARKKISEIKDRFEAAL